MYGSAGREERRGGNDMKFTKSKSREKIWKDDTSKVPAIKEKVNECEYKLKLCISEIFQKA